jgi:hypothetical protein
MDITRANRSRNPATLHTETQDQEKSAGLTRNFVPELHGKLSA